LANERALLVSGIGDPDSFETTVHELGIVVAGHERFGDHHHYQHDDIERIDRSFRDVGASVILTTHKDLVRLTSDRARRLLNERPVYVVAIRQVFVDDAAPLEQLLLKKAQSF
jgi:tetraacyldisaccharide 4'-kinase